MIPIVQKEIDTFVDVVWNSHRIRDQKIPIFQIVFILPNHIYSFADKYGMEECGMQLRLCYHTGYETSFCTM